MRQNNNINPTQPLDTPCCAANDTRSAARPPDLGHPTEANEEARFWGSFGDRSSSWPLLPPGPRAAATADRRRRAQPPWAGAPDTRNSAGRSTPRNRPHARRPHPPAHRPIRRSAQPSTPRPELRHYLGQAPAPEATPPPEQPKPIGRRTDTDGWQRGLAGRAAAAAAPEAFHPYPPGTKATPAHAANCTITNRGIHPDISRRTPGLKFTPGP